ncbi:glycosyltransferase [Demequina subtropica]|uniref:glycosyltransferase n=1 Tax=Demequina subtropica TaxID=1638989 RepID=UPI0007836DBF|nr:glycosyltransferase [Demequina subtropica]
MTGLIVHEWIARLGGSEKVVSELVAMRPESDVEVLWVDDPGALAGVQGRIIESPLARTPLRRSKAASVLAMPAVWRMGARRRDYDWVLVSTHAFAHHIKVPDGVPKLVYVHSPARYLWVPELDPRGSGLLARTLAPPLKALDRARAQEATSIVANSRFVSERIQHAWQRESGVIYPPVAVARIQGIDWEAHLTEGEVRALAALPGPFVLGMSRFIDYKRLDRVIEIAEAAGLPAVIAGDGPNRAALEAQARAASVPVRVVIAPSDAMLYGLFARAAALVFPAVEDFGIVPVEAMAVGTPVIANRVGGTGESVEHGVSGFLVDPDDTAEVVAALGAAGTLDRAAIAASARRFDTAVFHQRIEGWVGERVAA